MCRSTSVVVAHHHISCHSQSLPFHIKLTIIFSLWRQMTCQVWETKGGGYPQYLSRATSQRMRIEQINVINKIKAGQNSVVWGLFIALGWILTMICINGYWWWQELCHYKMQTVPTLGNGKGKRRRNKSPSFWQDLNTYQNKQDAG